MSGSSVRGTWRSERSGVSVVNSENPTRWSMNASGSVIDVPQSFTFNRTSPSRTRAAVRLWYGTSAATSDHQKSLVPIR
jgi:hypothetical protein